MHFRRFLIVLIMPLVALVAFVGQPAINLTGFIVSANTPELEGYIVPLSMKIALLEEKAQVTISEKNVRISFILPFGH